MKRTTGQTWFDLEDGPRRIDGPDFTVVVEGTGWVEIPANLLEQAERVASREGGTALIVRGADGARFVCLDGSRMNVTVLATVRTRTVQQFVDDMVSIGNMQGESYGRVERA